MPAPDIAEVPRLVGDAGHGRLTFGITQDKAVFRSIGVNPGINRIGIPRGRQRIADACRGIDVHVDRHAGVMLAVAREGGKQRTLLRAVDLLVVVVDRGLLLQRAVALRDLIVTAAGLGKEGVKHGVQRCHRRARQLDCRRADAITVGFVAVERHEVALILWEHIRAFEQRGDQDQVAAVHIVRRERQGLCARRLSHDRAGRGPRRGDLRG